MLGSLAARLNNRDIIRRCARLVVGLETSACVWKALEDAFAQDSWEREFHLTQEMTLLRKGTDNLSDYLRKIKNICDDLAAIGKPAPDKNKVFWLLQGLGYETFVTTMLKPPVPSYRDIVLPLQSHDTHAFVFTDLMAKTDHRWPMLFSKYKIKK
eukprot:TRINITY_DN8834_c0_g1_i2.p1 TRINITY_DN8834_c0_g1~~TRINITY_DN8834_c0_g1_i2.p1  ORF type:complete len:155 (-),score=11.89 TRINITY_DN8834_c0_g1_i2:732-1196(-)